ncbi:MAG: polya polymerase [Lachnospiraceae bacterium]|nr:polya polymerase [Lachnospiraceae bacterium]
MKVMNIDDPEKFFEVVNKCKGTVELVTSEGDRLNLKSQLTKYVALTKLFADNMIPEMEIVAHDPDDVNRLLEYMVSGK